MSLQYSPLPSANSIRILELCSESGSLPEAVEAYDGFLHNDIIKCKLHVTTVDDAGGYDALSYTWDNPFGIYRSKEEAERLIPIYESKVPIMCDEAVLEIGVNLYEALLLLRNAFRKSLGNFQDFHEKFPPRPLVQKMIWIDAICIDQDNLDERSAQVAIMSNIYRRADAVIIWLGPEDVYSRIAIQTLTKLASVDASTAKSFILTNHLWPKYKMPPDAPQLTPVHWLSVFAFFQRRWFQRAWIIQEAALANISVAIAGLACPFATLARAAWTIRESRCYTTIWKEGITKSIELPGVDTGMYRLQDDFMASDPMSIIGKISDVRAGLGLKVEPGMLRAEDAKPWNSLTLLAGFRVQKCKDPRDKVYSILSLWNNELTPVNKPVPLTVDYNSSISDVYIDAARAILLELNDLRLLSHVCGSSTKSDLPSWVPDWQQNASPLPFDTQLSVGEWILNKEKGIPFSASWESQWKPKEEFFTNKRTLAVRGSRIGVITKTAPYDPEDLAKLLPVLSEIPVLYLYFQISSVEDGDPLLDTVPKPMPSETMDHMNYLLNGDANLEGEIKRLSIQSSESKSQAISKEHKLIDPAQQTRFEALWRTLTADVWEGEHPASKDAGFAFVGSLIDDMHTLLQRGRSVLNPESAIFADGVNNWVMDVGEAMIQAKGGTFEDIDRTWRERIGILMALEKDEAMCLTHFDPEGIYGRFPPGKFLPEIKTSEDVLNYEFKDNHAVETWRAKIAMPRLVFATNTKKIGLGPKNMQTDNQVWILEGAKFPFVLRPKANGNYQLIGESYVHGIMHGEALWFGEAQFRDIVLE